MRTIKRKVTAIKNVEIPKYFLNLFKNSGYTKDVVKQEDILKILRNRAVLFLFMKLQNTEMLQALIGNGKSSLTAFASNIATGDYSHIFKIISSPKAKEAFRVSKSQNKTRSEFLMVIRSFINLCMDMLKTCNLKELKKYQERL